MTTERTDQCADVKARAQFWVVELCDDALTDSDLEAFRQWINADPEHEKAYMESLAVWSDIGQIHPAALSYEMASYRVTPPDSALLGTDRSRGSALPHTGFIDKLLDRMLPGRSTLRWLSAAAMVSLLVIMFVTGGYNAKPIFTDYATVKSQIKDITLSDGSSVTLSAKSRLLVRFDDNTRWVHLNAGEAFFSVAKDADRPFVVVVAGAAVRVVGTQFNVHRGSERVRVSVKEGVVELLAFNQKARAIKNAGQPELARIGAMQRVIASHRGDILIRDEVASDTPGAWREGRLDYQGASLSEVVADANRYYDNDITIASGNLSTLKVTASFRTDRIDEMFETLAQALPIVIERTPYGSVILKERKDAAQPPKNQHKLL